MAKMYKGLLVGTLLYFTTSFVARAQTIPVVWYNCENLFDAYDDSLKLDEAFTPTGDYHWTTKKYCTKINQISKVLLSASGWDEPVLIGLCEVENKHVLYDLVKNSALEALRFKFIHQESKDRRGIDVALLYNPKRFTPIDTSFVCLKPSWDTSFVSRDILYCKGVFETNDTVHVFANHWPSKYGGAIITEDLRVLAGKTLLELVDSILEGEPNAKILAMGDFNETSTEKALMTLDNSSLNVMVSDEKDRGTLKYKGSWSQIDYFALSQGLLVGNDGLVFQKWNIAYLDFLLERDDTYQGVKPFRTNIGFRYHGGYSDHLPIVLYLQKKN